MSWSDSWRNGGDREMDRERLLTLLLFLLCGMALHVLPDGPDGAGLTAEAPQRERRMWLLVWRPLIPALIVAAWLCGWELVAPDPVPEHVGIPLIIACSPAVLVALRAIVRAAFGLRSCPGESGIATVGLIRPRILVSGDLARRMDARALRAALAHEEAHQRHHDPLRIWIAQLMTDLQWPRPSANKRLRSWLGALEMARDDEARANGVDGADLAAAIIAALRYRGSTAGVGVRLTGDGNELKDRIARLLQPRLQPAAARDHSVRKMLPILLPILLIAGTTGIFFGVRVITELLAITA